MKKRKSHVSKKEVRLTIPSTNGLGENSGSILPTDLIVEILSRLPAKSTARFRCVSKDWAFIICRQDFTDLFLKMSSARPRLLLTFQTDGMWSFFSSPQSLISDQNSLLVVDNHLHVPKVDSFRVCSPVCGLVCTKDEWIFSGRNDARMMICNPSTGVSKLLPKVRTRRGRVITYIGYDQIEKQCKVLCMTICGKPKYQAEQHQVLTLGTKKPNWRMIECTVSHYPYNNEICINGVLYYLARETDGDLETSMIVCFDVRSEKFNFIINKDLEDLLVLSTTLINYKGKLGAVCPDEWGFDGRATRLEVWVMDNAQEHKWSKHIHILPPLWKNLVANTQVYIAGVIGTTEVVFSPYVLSNPFYIFHLNMEKNSLTRVEIQGIGPLQGQNIYTFLNHVENLKSLL